MNGRTEATEITLLPTTYFIMSLTGNWHIFIRCVEYSQSLSVPNINVSDVIPPPSHDFFTLSCFSSLHFVSKVACISIRYCCSMHLWLVSKLSVPHEIGKQVFQSIGSLIHSSTLFCKISQNNPYQNNRVPAGILQFSSILLPLLVKLIVHTPLQDAQCSSYMSFLVDLWSFCLICSFSSSYVV